MEQVNVAEFTRLSETLGRLLRIAELAEPKFAKTIIQEELRTQLPDTAAEWREWLSPLGFEIALDSVKAMEALAAKPNATYGDASELLKEFLGRLHAHLDHTLFLAVRSEAARFYRQPILFGTDVSAKFSSTSYDIEEAGICLSLDRGTACVFHLTRILQAGLYALAKDLGIDPADRNWGQVIADLEKEIKVRRKRGPGASATQARRAAWKADNEFYSGAAMHFDHLLEAFRNRAIHKTGKVFPPDKARSLFDHTRDFMQQLASRLEQVP